MENPKKIILITFYPFTERIYELYDFNEFINNGVDIVVLDVGQIFYKKTYSSYKPKNEINESYIIKCSKRKEVKHYFSTIDEDYWVCMTYPINFKSLWLYTYLKSIKAKIFVEKASVIPYVNTNNSPLIISSIKELIKKGFLYILSKYIFIDLIIGSGKRSLDQYRKAFGVAKNTKELFIHQRDYDIYQQRKNNYVNQTNTAVFIDSYMPFHPDFKIFNQKVGITPEKYYEALNNYFNFFEKEYSMKVIIAAHPKSQYEKHPNFYKERKLYKNQTDQLIAQSKIVMMHGSTAVNFIILYKKPMIILDISKISNYTGGSKLAEIFNENIIDLSNKDTYQNPITFSINHEKYSQYKDDFIKYPNSSNQPLWKQILDSL